MKLRSSAVMIAIAALLALPMGVLAATQINVQGTDYYAGSAVSGSGSNDGTWSWDGSDAMILDNYDGGTITAVGDLDISLEGENAIDGGSSWALNVSGGDLSISGSEGSSLELSCTAPASFVDGALVVNDGDLTIDGADLTVRTDATSITYDDIESAITVRGGNILIENGATVDAELMVTREECYYLHPAIWAGGKYGDTRIGNITIDDSTVSAVVTGGGSSQTGHAYVGIMTYAVGTSITINDSTVHALGADAGIYVSGGYAGGDTRLHVTGVSEIVNPQDGVSRQVHEGDSYYYSTIFTGDSFARTVDIEVAHNTLTYDLAGGTLDGRTGTFSESYKRGSTAIVADAPTREGYSFLYWEGSEYQPGDTLVMDADHTLTAVWEKDPEPEPEPEPEPTPEPEPEPAPAPAPAPAPEPATVLPKTGDVALLVEASVSATGALAALASALRMRRRNR